jgi:hypothetical protein
MPRSLEQFLTADSAELDFKNIKKICDLWGLCVRNFLHVFSSPNLSPISLCLNCTFCQAHDKSSDFFQLVCDEMVLALKLLKNAKTR